MISRTIRAGVLLAAVAAAGCRDADAGAARTPQPDGRPEPSSPSGAAASAAGTVWQLSAFALLARCGFDGILPVREVKQHGDLGLGAGDRLTGEMALVDGRFYQFLEDGRAVEAQDTMRMPFAAVTQGGGWRTIPVARGMVYDSLKQLQNAVDAQLPTTSAFYAIRMEGTWTVLTARTYKPQTPGHYTLLKDAPSYVYTMQAVRGTMVGFRGPSYADSLSVPGYHLHFVNQDRTLGGHVISATADSVSLMVSERPEFTLRMPPAPVLP